MVANLLPGSQLGVPAISSTQSAKAPLPWSGGQPQGFASLPCELVVDQILPHVMEDWASLNNFALASRTTQRLAMRAATVAQRKRLCRLEAGGPPPLPCVTRREHAAGRLLRLWSGQNLLDIIEARGPRMQPQLRQAICDRIVQRWPSWADAHVMQADALLGEMPPPGYEFPPGYGSSAAAAYRRALALEPDHVGALFGIALASLDVPAAAQAAFDNVLERRPDHRRARGYAEYLRRGFAFRAQVGERNRPLSQLYESKKYVELEASVLRVMELRRDMFDGVCWASFVDGQLELDAFAARAGLREVGLKYDIICFENFLAAALLGQGKRSEALESIEVAVRSRPWAAQPLGLTFLKVRAEFACRQGQAESVFPMVLDVCLTESLSPNANFSERVVRLVAATYRHEDNFKALIRSLRDAHRRLQRRRRDSNGSLYCDADRFGLGAFREAVDLEFARVQAEVRARGYAPDGSARVLRRSARLTAG